MVGYVCAAKHLCSVPAMPLPRISALGDEYKDAAIAANDASEEIRGAFRKSKNEKTRKKQAKTRQPLMDAFLKPQKK